MYYADKCKDRKQLLDNLVTRFFLPNIQSFPHYEIQDKDIKPGFDGVMLSGWWTDAEWMVD